MKCNQTMLKGQQAELQRQRVPDKKASKAKCRMTAEAALPVVCRTPFGLPVLPEVYSRNSGSSDSIHSTYTGMKLQSANITDPSLHCQSGRRLCDTLHPVIALHLQCDEALFRALVGVTVVSSLIDSDRKIEPSVKPLHHSDCTA